MMPASTEVPLLLFSIRPPTPPQKIRTGGVPSGIFVTPLPPVFHFVKRIPTPPVLHKTGDYPPIVPVSKGAFRVECPTRGGGAPTPSVMDKGGGVSHGWGGGTPLLPEPDMPPTLLPSFFNVGG